MGVAAEVLANRTQQKLNALWKAKRQFDIWLPCIRLNYSGIVACFSWHTIYELGSCNWQSVHVHKYIDLAFPAVCVDKCMHFLKNATEIERRLSRGPLVAYGWRRTPPLTVKANNLKDTRPLLTNNVPTSFLLPNVLSLVLWFWPLLFQSYWGVVLTIYCLVVADGSWKGTYVYVLVNRKGETNDQSGAEKEEPTKTHSPSSSTFSESEQE
jgi:hypothetical protein